MQLAFQSIAAHRARRRESLGADVWDLVLLDTGTGHRRRLVEDVFFTPPRWSADGRRVRYEVRLPHGFVQREIDVETGAVQDAGDDRPDGAGLPGFSDRAWSSPAGRWLVYRHETSVLCVASADSSAVFALTVLGGAYATADAYWSPCGTKLTAYLTAGDDSGAYVIDLRTGEHRRVSPGPDPALPYQPTWFVQSWSPDGAWIAATKGHWHNPKTFDHTWHDLWLLPAAAPVPSEPVPDRLTGTAAPSGAVPDRLTDTAAPSGAVPVRLTDDGRSRHPAIRPSSGAAPANGEHELTFAWARPLRRPGEPPASGEVLAAQIRRDLTVVLMVRTAGGVRYPAVTGAGSVADAFARIDEFLAANDCRPGDGFVVAFRRYATDDDAGELAVLELAHLIAAEAGSRFWRFVRDVPPPPDWIGTPRTGTITG